MIGVSLRHAQAAGFHLENEDPSNYRMDKRNIAHIWRALHSIECILTSITGRPRIINPRDCTVALSSNSESRSGTFTHTSSVQETPSAKSQSFDHIGEVAYMNMEKCLNAWVRLDVIQHKILASLYSAQSVGHPWELIETHISSLLVEMEEWAQQALASVDPVNSMTEGSRQTREHVLLFLYYQSARICVTRPCLCRLDRHLEDRRESSITFVQDTADACIQAALNIASALPKHTNHRWLYEVGPWWSGIHISKFSMDSRLYTDRS